MRWSVPNHINEICWFLFTKLWYSFFKLTLKQYQKQININWMKKEKKKKEIDQEWLVKKMQIKIASRWSEFWCEYQCSRLAYICMRYVKGWRRAKSHYGISEPVHATDINKGGLSHSLSLSLSNSRSRCSGAGLRNSRAAARARTHRDRLCAPPRRVSNPIALYNFKISGPSLYSTAIRAPRIHPFLLVPARAW